MSSDSASNDGPNIAPSLTLRPPILRQAASLSPSLDAPSPYLDQRDPRSRVCLDKATGLENTTAENANMSKTSSAATDKSNVAVLQVLKDAVSAKMISNQQRVQGSTPPASRAPSGGIRRIVSIKEEEIKQSPSPKLSPTLAASFDSPLQSTSTDSTESAKTVKGSAQPTPAATALRTPSYPFPYVPGTPRTWNSSFHRPFTALSPTISSEGTRDPDTPRDARSSGPNTPVPTNSAFMPPAFVSSEASQDHASAPNLYDLVLMLNLEPGMTSWWATVTQIFQDFYGADRLSLSLPADAGELENVPWGQKATFNQSGAPTPSASFKSQAGTETSNSQRGIPADSKHIDPILSRTHLRRPQLVARHSYAGFERDLSDTTAGSASTAATTRPGAPRTKSYAPHVVTSSEFNFDALRGATGVGKSPERLFSISDTEFSAVNTDRQTGPYTQVLQHLRALDYETEALLEASSVNKIIERGKLVVLTRDFSLEASGRKAARDEIKMADKPQHIKPSATKPNLRSDFHGLARSAAYEEYEQMPSSPWAQSPAPSPAIQTEAEENPFFSQANVDEGSFKPPATSPDYAHSSAVEAIGVDKASTVIHIPLVHPRYLSNFPFRFGKGAAPHSKTFDSGDEASEGRTSPLKSAPIAILSFSVPVAPYPQYLAQSLQLLSPHLATTYEMAQQYMSLQNQILHRRSRGLSLGEHKDDLTEADLDASIDSTSLTSPSDYSGRSRQSPGGSVGTPGWEHAISGLTHHPRTSTPGQISAAEMVDSYFDVKNRISQSHTQSGLHTHHARPRETTTRDSESTVRKGGWDDTGTGSRRTGQKISNVDSRLKKPHTYLHSYGADFSSTFQTLPSATTPSQTPLRLTNVGIIPSPDQPDMPPPSERLLRTIVDSLPVQIFIASPGSGVLSWVNSKFIVYRGHESSEVVEDPWKAIHPDDRPGYVEEWQRSLNTGQPFSHKVRLLRFDNAYRWFYVRATPLKDKRQKIVHWAGTYMDIHEQHIAEVHAARQQETAASEAKYRALANSSPQIVFAVTRSQGVVFCNSQWPTFSGQTEAQAMGVGFMNYVHPQDLAKCRLPTLKEDGSLEVDAPTTIPLSSESPSPRPLGSEDSSESGNTVTSPGVDATTSQLPQAKLYKLASTGILKLSRDSDGRPSYSTEVRLRSKEGQYRWHLVRVLLSEPTRSDGTEEETWYGTCTDINDHKILEQTLKDTMDAKSRFLSNMSHEIRTPLNGILGMVNFLIDSSLSNEQMEHVNIIRNSTEGLRDLINDILDLSKVEAGMITLTMEWMHVRSLIEEVNDIMFALAVDKGLELNYSVDPQVPSMIKGDRFRIRQVLLNIVGNAIKFTQRGEVFVKCDLDKTPSTDLADNETRLQFEVIDTGKGFTEKEAEFLFKRFSQIDSSSSKAASGTGLGLAISMQLVELHGGIMRANSQPGKGASFTFTIKCIMPTESDRPSITASSSIESALPSTAAVIPTPQPITETSQGMQFPRKISQDSVVSPTGYTPPVKPRHTNSTASSGSSDPSLRTAASSIRSQRSSVSSAEMAFAAARSPPMPLELPAHIREQSHHPSVAAEAKRSDESVETVRPSSTEPAASSPLKTMANLSDKPTFQPPNIFSILVICSLLHTREAIIKHIELTLPKMTPHHITARSSVDECADLLRSQDNPPVRFSHLVVDLPAVAEITALLDFLLTSASLATTCAVIVTDVRQQREISAAAPYLDFKALAAQRRILFLFKPLKPSKMALVFDPQKTSELSTDRNQDSAQAVALSQKAIFEDLKSRLGGRGLKVLLVEDNKTSQMVLSRFMGRAGVDVEVVADGAEGTRRVFEGPDGGVRAWDLVFVSSLASPRASWYLL
jgi:PAS domain S-box-containing protein